jgi:hypothetical protein
VVCLFLTTTSITQEIIQPEMKRSKILVRIQSINLCGNPYIVKCKSIFLGIQATLRNLNPYLSTNLLSFESKSLSYVNHPYPMYIQKNPVLCFYYPVSYPSNVLFPVILCTIQYPYQQCTSRLFIFPFIRILTPHFLPKSEV